MLTWLLRVHGLEISQYIFPLCSSEENLLQLLAACDRADLLHSVQISWHGNADKGKGKVHPITGHEDPGIALLFL